MAELLWSYWWVIAGGYALAFAGVVAITVRATLRDARANGGTFFDGTGPGSDDDGTGSGTDSDDGDDRARANLARALNRDAGSGPMVRPRRVDRLNRVAFDRQPVRTDAEAIR